MSNSALLAQNDVNYVLKKPKTWFFDECLERVGRVRPGTARERKANCAFMLVCAQSFSFDLVSAPAACLCSAHDLAIASCCCSCSCFALALAFARARALTLALALTLAYVTSLTYLA